MGYVGQPKIIVLGIDGLEYNLVKEWRLKNIMQKTYCKLDLSDYNVIVTPPIWGSMLTGKIDDEIMKIWEKTAEIAYLKSDIKQKWWAELGVKVLPFSVRMRIWEVFFRDRRGGDPFEITSNYVNDKKQINIFQFFQKPWTNDIPSYTKNTLEYSVRKQLLGKAVHGDKTPFKNYVIKKYKNDKLQLFYALDKQEYDIIFWYTWLIDVIGHLFGNSLPVMTYYLEINELVGKIREKYADSCIYVISDHGMEPFKGKWGMHSNHAFFSSNTGETIDKPFQLYDLILKHRSV